MPSPRAALLRRKRDQGRHPAPFRHKRSLRWILAGVIALAGCAISPLIWPSTSAAVEWLATVASLVFLLATLGLAVGLKARAFVASTFVVAAIYAATVWAPLVYDIEDFFILAVLAGFFLFAVAGFNLVFVFEEVVYDAHRLLHARNPLWSLIPVVVVAALSFGLPVLRQATGFWSTPLWIASVASLILIGSWWLLSFSSGIPRDPVLREIHLLSAALLVATLVATGISNLSQTTGLLPSVVALGLIIGTWVYVSYTTLQRAHFLLGTRNPLPWITLMLSASFAVLVHVQVHWRVANGDPSESLGQILRMRVLYLEIGIWLGIIFLVVRGIWWASRGLRDMAGVGERSRQTAGKTARIAEELLRSEQRVSQVLSRFMHNVDGWIPGKAPEGWEIDSDSQQLREISSEE